MKTIDKLLKNYRDDDFVLQQKARVLAVAFLAVLCLLPVVLIYSYYLQVSVERVNLYILIPIVVGIFLFAAALWLLTKGLYETAAHLAIVIALVLAWTILFADRFGAVARLDTIVYIMGIMTLTALVIYRQKGTILFYFVINESLLFIFLFIVRNELGLSDFEVLDYFVDNTIVFIFISVIAYNVIAVNTRALDRAEEDIEKLAQAEKELQDRNTDLAAANLRFATVMDSLGSAVYVADLQTYEILYTNQKIKDQFGDVTGQICWKTFHPRFDGPCNFCTNHLLTDTQGKPTGVHIHEFHNPDDGQWYESREQAIQWVDGRLARMEIATDITEQRKSRELMMETEKMATVGGLAAGMGHEINNPLGIIVQCVQNTKRRLSGDIPGNLATAQKLGLELDAINRYLHERKILEYVDGISEAGSRAAKIVADMLQFSRKHDDDKTPSDLNLLIDEALEMVSKDYNLKKHYDFKHIKVVKVCAPDLPNVLCHPNEIQQVLLNLLMNAAYALRDIQREHFLPQIDLRTWVEEKWAAIELADNGTGIETETLKHIFEPFFTTKGPRTGTGLGLSVSYFIIKSNHNGEINAESELGQGSTFTIRLPLQ